MDRRAGRREHDPRWSVTDNRLKDPSRRGQTLRHAEPGRRMKACKPGPRKASSAQASTSRRLGTRLEHAREAIAAAIPSCLRNAGTVTIRILAYVAPDCSTARGRSDFHSGVCTAVFRRAPRRANCSPLGSIPIYAEQVAKVIELTKGH
jgi:hypothetical protein